MIISRPVHTVLASRRPGIGALASGRQAGLAVAASQPEALKPSAAASTQLDTETMPAERNRNRIFIALLLQVVGIRPRISVNRRRRTQIGR